MIRKFFCFLIFLISNNIISQERIYPLSVVDTPPLFSLCGQFSDFQKKNCFEETIKSHINSNIQFPEEAFEIGVSGRVLVYFIIDKDGRIEQIRSRGPHESLENEAKRIISILPSLSPAYKDNSPVKVSYSLPIDFYLLSRPSSQDIKIFAGANIYSDPDNKSKILAIIKSNSLWSAASYGEFWQINYSAGVGYISKDDASESKLDLVSIKEKNDTSNILETNFDFNDLTIQTTADITADFNYEPSNDQTLASEENKESFIESNSRNSSSDKSFDISENLTIQTTADITADFNNDDNSILNSAKNIDSSIELILKELNNDFSKLNEFEEELKVQKEINRKIPGTNQADLYYTNALSKFIKLLNQDINLKYSILSAEYPSAFINTKYEVRNTQNAERKANELKSKSYTISNSFFYKEFGSSPEGSNKEKINIIIKEINDFAYLKLENTQSLIDESLELTLTNTDYINEMKESNSQITDESSNDLVDKTEIIDSEKKSNDYLFDEEDMTITDNSSSENQSEIKEELQEVRDMLNEMREMIQINNIQQQNQIVEQKESVSINDLAQDLINGSITQEEFFKNLKLLDETKDNNELKSSIDNLRTLDEFLNLNILTQSIKMKSELLQSISEVNSDSKLNSIEVSKTKESEVVCTDFTSFSYSDGRQNIVSSNKFDITNNSDKISIYPILGSSKSSILVNLKIEGKDMCFDSDSKILISFRDGSRTEINHESYNNCDGETVIFLGKIFGEKAFQDLNELKYKEIQSIRVWMKNSLKEVTLSRVQSQELMFTIDCLSSYMN